MDIMRGIIREDILFAFLAALDHAERIEKLTRQPKELVNQKQDNREWKRNDEETFN